LYSYLHEEKSWDEIFPVEMRDSTWDCIFDRSAEGMKMQTRLKTEKKIQAVQIDVVSWIHWEKLKIVGK
jgi:hypothetical protein